VSSVRVQWPSSLGAIFNTANYIFSVTSSQVISFDCVFASDAGAPVAIKRVLMHLLAPLGVLAVLVAIWLLFHYRARKMSAQNDGCSSEQLVPLSYVLPVIFCSGAVLFLPYLGEDHPSL
jgi:uncharacterized membrane protein